MDNEGLAAMAEDLFDTLEGRKAAPGSNPRLIGLLCCPKCGEKWESNKYKDALELDGYYFTVHLVACSNCGRVNDKDSYIE